MNTNTQIAVSKYEAAMLEHSNDAKFGPASKVNCKVCELPNFAQLKADYIAAFDVLTETKVDSLKRNEIALLKTVSHGSIKSAHESGKSTYDILTGVNASRALTADKAGAFLEALKKSDPEAYEAIIAKLVNA